VFNTVRVRTFHVRPKHLYDARVATLHHSRAIHRGDGIVGKPSTNATQIRRHQVEQATQAKWELTRLAVVVKGRIARAFHRKIFLVI